MMKSKALAFVGLAGALALALSVTTGAWANNVNTSPTPKVYQTFVASKSIPYTSFKLLTTPLPVGDYVVNVAIGFAGADGGEVFSCSLQTADNGDTVRANTGGANSLGNDAGEGTAAATLVIDGTVEITHSDDHVDVACTNGAEQTSTASGSLTAQTVGSIKLTSS